MLNSGWLDLRENLSIINNNGLSDISVPLKMILGLAEDHKKIIINCRHDLVLTRAHTDDGASLSTSNATTAAGDVKVKIDKIEWLMPHVQ